MKENKEKFSYSEHGCEKALEYLEDKKIVGLKFMDGYNVVNLANKTWKKDEQNKK